MHSLSTILFLLERKEERNMLDIKFVRENPEKVKENIKKKFQDKKLGLVDEVIALDSEYREVKVKADNYRKDRNEISDKIGNLMREGKKEEGLSLKEQVVKINDGVAIIDAGGAKREISSQLIEDLEPGDYVMVHAGVAIAKITDEDDSETDQVLEDLF